MLKKLFDLQDKYEDWLLAVLFIIGGIIGAILS